MGAVKKVTEFDGTKMEEYRGSYSLSAHRFAVGKYWAQWAKFRIGGSGHDHYQAKDWPITVKLGTRETAIKTLVSFLTELGCRVTIDDPHAVPGEPVMVDMDDDVPGTQKSLPASGQASFPGADIWAHAKKEFVDRGGNPF